MTPLKSSSYLALFLSFSLLACQGGRENSFQSLSSDTEQPSSDTQNGSGSGNAGPGNNDILLDPLGELIAPTGLGYQVDTIYGTGPDAIHRTAYGIDALPIGVDVDGDSSTGNVLGADISVHFFSLLLYARVEIHTLDGAPDPMPLKVEVSVLDPRNLLGLPGLFGIVDPDLRVALGMDARSSSAPGGFTEELTIVDSLFEFLPRFTSASLQSTVEDATGPVAATLSLYADRSGERADGLELSAETNPATNSQIEVTLTPDSEESILQLTVDQAAQLDIQVASYDGMQSQPTGGRDINVTLDSLNSQFTMTLNGVDGLSSLDGVDTRYLIEADQNIEHVILQLSDSDADGNHGEAYARISPLPQRLEVVRGADDSLSMETSSPIDDLVFAQADNTSITLGDGFKPSSPFEKHLIRQFDGAVDGVDTNLLQVRLGGLQSLQAQLGEEMQLMAKLQTAPLELREESPDGFQEAVIERLPAEFELAFPDTERQLALGYFANESTPGLSYREQTTEQTTQASITPLPASLILCSGSDDECGSHGIGTDTSLNFETSEQVTLNYQQQSSDGRTQSAIDEFKVSKLQFDLATRSG
ncbi:MAG: hypothetical protein ACSHXK_16060, partial [Oceanococcus sp.]